MFTRVCDTSFLTAIFPTHHQFINRLDTAQKSRLPRRKAALQIVLYYDFRFRNACLLLQMDKALIQDSEVLLQQQQYSGKKGILPYWFHQVLLKTLD